MSSKKKFQVFVCSTFLDLKKQRQEIFQALWKNDCIPVGMEGFVPAHQDQWRYITNRIEESDYFVIVVAHRYGSQMPGGRQSVTEAEYDYARQLDLPIARFVIEPAVKWKPTVDSHSTGTDKARLDAFKLRLHEENGRQFGVSLWNEHTLVVNVMDAVRAMINMVKRPGLIRGGDVDVDLENHGVRRLHRGLRNVSKADILSPKNRLIRIVLNDGYNFFKQNIDELRAALDAGSRVQIILLHPGTPCLDVIAEKCGKSVAQQRRDILSTVDLLKKEFQGRRNFQMLGNKQYLCYAGFIGDDACLVDFYFNYRLESGRQDDRVALECVSGQGEGSLYTKISDDFEYFWRKVEAEDGSDLMRISAEA